VKDYLKNMTLGEVSDLFTDGRISREEAEEYAAWWNSVKYRNTIAKVYSRTIGNNTIREAE